MLSNQEAMTMFYRWVWRNLEPRLSPFSHLVAERETLAGPIHHATQNLGGKKMRWQRAVVKSRNCFCNNLSQGGGGGGKKGDLPKCAALAHGPPNHSEKVCPQWFFFFGKHLQALWLYLRQKYCNNVYAKNCVFLTISRELDGKSSKFRPL